MPDGSARTRLERRSPLWATALVSLGLVALVLLSMTAWTSSGAVVYHEGFRPGTSYVSPTISQDCAGAVLQTVTASPNPATVFGLKDQTFAARAVDSCGNVVTDQTTFTWALSTPVLGELSTTSGTSTTFTACLAPMDGLLRLTATFGGVVRTANVSISVSDVLASTNNSAPSGSGNVTGAGASPASPGGRLGAELGLVVVLALLGGLVVFVVRERARRRPSDPVPFPNAPTNADETDASERPQNR